MYVTQAVLTDLEAFAVTAMCYFGVDA